jgi:glycyl-tRNA synthetase
MNPKVWEASGHVGGFSDPLIDCKKCNSRERADNLIEDYLGKNKDTDTPNNRAGEKTPAEDIMRYINDKKIKCPKCGAIDWTEPKKFNLMFKTQQGVIEGEGTDIYLRPETAQGIFVNFRNILDTTRNRIPFGIAQVGKAFRNEITPGNFMFRVREFYQMEIEYFVENDEKIGLAAFDVWMNESKKRWIEEIGIKPEKLKFREHEKDELSFYSKATFDVEYEFPRGWGELQGIAYRTDYDLKQHIQHSGKDLQYHDPQTGKRYVPHVIEPSRGLTRAILTAMIDAYDEEKYTDGNGNEQTRIVARFHKNIAPIKYAIMPLVKKDEKMVAMAREIYKNLTKHHMCEWDASGNI